MVKLAVSPQGVGLLLGVEVLLVLETPSEAGVSGLPMVQGEAGNPHLPLTWSASSLLLLLKDTVWSPVPAGQALYLVGTARPAALAPPAGGADHALRAGAGPGPGVTAHQGLDLPAPQLHHLEPPGAEHYS